MLRTKMIVAVAVIAVGSTVPLPPGAVHGGVVQDALAVTSALRQLWAGYYST